MSFDTQNGPRGGRQPKGALRRTPLSWDAFPGRAKCPEWVSTLVRRPGRRWFEPRRGAGPRIWVPWDRRRPIRKPRRELLLQRTTFAFTTGTDERSKAQVLHANIPVRQQVGLVTGRDHGVVIDASGAHVPGLDG